jgi:hypothetical protein
LNMMRTSNLFRTRGLAVIVVLIGGSVAARQSPPTAPKITEIKLEAFGWQPPVPYHYGEGDGAPSQTVTIDSQGRVLASFTVRGPNEGLRRRSHPGLRLRIIRFGPDGKTDLSLAVPTNNWMGNGVYLDDHDRIIARADDKLQMLVGGGNGSGQVKWKTLASCGPHCFILQSLTRRTVYLYTWDADPPVTVISMDDPSNVSSCQVPRMGLVGFPQWATDAGLNPQSITDNFAYFNHDPGAPIGPIKRQPVLYRWPLCDDSDLTKLAVVAPGQVLAVNDDALLFGGTVYGRDGKEKQSCSYRSLFGKHESGGLWLPPESRGAVVDESGSRVLLRADTERGGSLFLDITPRLTAQRIVVYDMTRCRQVASVPLPPPYFYTVLHLAMSPDGHRVAALVKDTLTIADVP